MTTKMSKSGGEQKKMEGLGQGGDMGWAIEQSKIN